MAGKKADTTKALATTVEGGTPEEKEHRRQVAILRAVGLDRVPVEQRELALAIANRYDLDLMLRHLVLIDGRPYIARDGLLHVAHRSGQFDGIEVTPAVLDGDFWRSTCSVFRKDMSHPFTYHGRYPKNGQNQKFAPEMAIKVAEVMALRRAFDVSAPTEEERWDSEVPGGEPEPPKGLAQLAAEKAAATTSPGAPQTPTTPVPPVEGVETPEAPEEAPSAPLFAQVEVADGEFREVNTGTGEVVEPDPQKGRLRAMAEAVEADINATAAKEAEAPKAKKPPAKPTATVAGDPAAGEAGQCAEVSPLSGERCRLYADHKGHHRSSPNESW